MADLSVESELSGTVGTAVSGSIGTTVGGSFGAVGPVTLSGIPDNYTFKVTELPKIQIGVDPLHGTVKLEPVRLDIGPIETSLSIKEIPSVRMHLPANYQVALSLFGLEVAAVRLCGESQIITEPYTPNPCEVCGPRDARAVAAELRKIG